MASASVGATRGKKSRADGDVRQCKGHEGKTPTRLLSARRYPSALGEAELPGVFFMPPDAGESRLALIRRTNIDRYRG
jgi:hypothetical protein